MFSALFILRGCNVGVNCHCLVAYHACVETLVLVLVFVNCDSYKKRTPIFLYPLIFLKIKSFSTFFFQFDFLFLLYIP